MVQTTQQIEHESSLIEKAKKDVAAFRPLYDFYYKPIFLFVHHRVGKKDLSADLTSQVFLKALQNINRYQFRGLPFSAWLYRIALNEVTDFFRRQSKHRYVTIEEEQLNNFHIELMDNFSIDHLHDRLEEMLQRLDSDELHIIELRFFEERPFKEMAQILGISEIYSKVKTYRVLDKLRKHFTAKK